MKDLIRFHTRPEHLTQIRKNPIPDGINLEGFQLTCTHVRMKQIAINVGDYYTRWKHSPSISRCKRSFEITCYYCVCRDRFTLSTITYAVEEYPDEGVYLFYEPLDRLCDKAFAIHGIFTYLPTNMM